MSVGKPIDVYDQREELYKARTDSTDKDAQISEQIRVNKELREQLAEALYVLDVIARRYKYALDEETHDHIQRQLNAHKGTAMSNPSTEQFDFLKMCGEAMKQINAPERKFEVVWSERMIQAFQLAAKLHQGHTDKGNVPIFDHLKHVALTVLGITYDEDAFIVAMLHDSVEDIEDWSIHDVRAGFGDRVADAVVLLTHDVDTVWYADYIRNLAESGNLIAIEVKIADLIHNTDPRRANCIAQRNLRESHKVRYMTALEILLDARMSLSVV